MPGTWQPLKTSPPANVETMLLLSDGSVMAHETSSPNWHRLRPNAAGDYMQGSWFPVAAMPNNSLIPVANGGPVYAPLYFASAVLRDGTMFVAGGEYNTGIPNSDVVATQIYDPVLDEWRIVNPPTGWNNIGDAPSCVLPDGRLLLGNINSTQTAIYDPVTSSWTAAANKTDINSEEGYTLLPDHTVLVPEVTNHPQAEKYLPWANTWVSASAIPAGSDLFNQTVASFEIGPAILLPDGRVLGTGASGHTALYTAPPVPNQPGSWTAGPDFPSSGGNLQQAFDAPACLLPNGRVLCLVGPPQPSGWAGPPCSLYEFNGSGFDAVPGVVPPLATDRTYNFRMLLLPTGQVLLSHTDGNDVWIYTPDGTPRHSWRPRISHVRRRLQRRRVYRLRGRQLTGLSQANAYGDDAQMATNYPLVRLHGVGGGPVIYCRTFDHSTMAVATRHHMHHTFFEVPAAAPHGAYRLVVIANGIPSEPVRVRIVHQEEDEESEIVELVRQKPVRTALLALAVGFVLGRL